MNKAVKIIIFLLLVIGVMFGIYKMSSMSSSKSNGKSADILSILIVETLDITNEYGITDLHPNDAKIERASKIMNTPMRKVMHASEYLVLAFVLMTLANIITNHKYYGMTLIISLVLAVFFAITDEYHQMSVSGRSAQALDVVIDSIGAAIGIIFYTTYHLVYKRGYRRAIKEIEEENGTVDNSENEV